MKPPLLSSAAEADDWLHKNGIAAEVKKCPGPVWAAENGDLICYSTARVSTGKFALVIYRGDSLVKAEWVYVREFAKRKDAKARAAELYYEKSPVKAARRDARRLAYAEAVRQRASSA